MALSVKEKERLDKMSFANGGGFLDFMTGRKKAKPTGDKILFIGLGGKGSKTVASIKTGVYKKIACPQDKVKPDNFEYLIIDTDSDAIEELQKADYGEVGLDGTKEMETCQLYDKTAADKLKPENKKMIPSYIREWINPLLNATLQGKGAGGIRQAGRYLLFGEDAFSRLRNILEKKLLKLHHQIVNPQKEGLIVYIFAGIGGGTGSGTIVDIPYIIRRICEDKQMQVKICSYLFLPDAYPIDASSAHIKVNSYAALKEIDVLMNISQMDGTAKFRAQYIPGFTVESTHDIFDSCVLVSGKKQNGLVKDPDQFTRSVVVDNVINLVTENQTNGIFLASSFLDNARSQEIPNRVNSLPDEVPRNAHYQYTVIGTGEIILPMEQILAYLAHGTMKMLDEAWDKCPQQKDVDGVLTALHMLPEEQAGQIESTSTVQIFQYIKDMGGPVDKKNIEVISGALFNSIKQMWLGYNVNLYNAWDISKNRELERIVTEFDKVYYKYFADPKAGIYYLQKLLNARVLDQDKINGIYYRIKKEYIGSIEGLIAGQREMQAQIEHRMEEIKQSLAGMFGGGFSRNSLIEEYRELCVGYLVCDNRIYLYRDLVTDCLKQLLGHIEHKINNLQKYVDIFAYMREIIDNNYRCVMEGILSQEEYAGRVLDFSKKGDEDTERVLAYLEQMMQETTPEGLATALEDMILHEEQKWVDSTKEFEPMKVFVQFLEKRYKDLPDLTLEKFMQIKYGADGMQTGVKALYEELQSRAEVIYSTTTQLSLNSLPSYKYIVLPNNATNISPLIQGMIAGANVAVAYSSDVNSIYWYNLVVGVPLFANVSMEEYEQMYEVRTVCGAHIWESDSDNWRDFPAIRMPEIWNAPNSNNRERTCVEDVKMDTQRFLEEGLIWKNESTNIYQTQCFIDDYSGQDAIMEWCRKEYLTRVVRTEDGRAPIGKKFWEELCTAFAEDMNVYAVNHPEVYLDLTDDNLYKVLRMNVFLYKKIVSTYQVYLECKKLIEEDNERRVAAILQKKNIKRFYDYVRTGIVKILEDVVILERENGEQEEILYFDNYTMIENRFYEYWAVLKMTEKYPEEELCLLDEYCTVLKADHSAETRQKYTELSDAIMESANKARESLKKLDVKKMLTDAGNESMITVYAEFYEELLRNRVGR